MTQLTFDAPQLSVEKSLSEVGCELWNKRVSGGLTMPVPTKLTLWGLPAALSVIVMESVKLPALKGVKVTDTAQDV
jgi:hypothetical protein